MAFIDLEAIGIRRGYLGGSSAASKKKKKIEKYITGLRSQYGKGTIVNTPGFPLKIQRFWHKSKSKLKINKALKGIKSSFK